MVKAHQRYLKMNINTKYNLQQKVYIKQLKVWGKVVAFFIECEDIQYYVRYFVALKPERCYFHEEELSSQDEESKLGFNV